MQISDNSLNEVPEMLRHVENWIKNNKVTDSKLAGIQKKIDAIDDEFKYDSAVSTDYNQLYELQAIVYHLKGQKTKAKKFADKALELGKPSSILTKKIADDGRLESAQVQNELNDDMNSRSTSIRFFYRSHNTVFWLSLLTLNIYNIYWVYRQWRTIRDTTGEKISPFWRAIFQVFFINSLLKRITTAAKDEGNDSPWSGGVTASSIAYILGIFIGNAIGRAEVTSQSQEVVLWSFSIILALLVALITRSGQNAANYFSLSVYGNDYNFRETKLGKIYGGEIVIATIGILITFAAATLSFVSYSNNTYPQGASSEISAAKTTMDSLTEQYNSCNDSLVSRRNTVDTTDGAAVDSYNADLAACESVRLQQNDAVANYNRLAGFKTED